MSGEITMISMACERERESRRHVRRGHDDFNGTCVRERERAGGMSGEVTMI